MSKKTLQDVIEKAKQIILKKNDEISFLQTGLKSAMGGKEPILLKMPGDLKIENFPDIQKVKIDNISDLASIFKKESKSRDIQDVRILNFPEQKDAEKVSGWVPNLIVHSVKSVTEHITKHWMKGIEVFSSDEDKLKPQVVIVVDRNGRPVDFSCIGQTMIVPSMGPTGGGVKKPATIIGSGRTTVTTSGTAVPIQSTSQVCREITITALDTNADAIFVGGSDVLATSGSEKGMLLTPTGSVTIDIDDISKVYIDARESGDTVTYTYVR